MPKYGHVLGVLAASVAECFFFTKCMNHPTADYSAQIKETKKGQLGQKTRLVAGATGS